MHRTPLILPLLVALLVCSSCAGARSYHSHHEPKAKAQARPQRCMPDPSACGFPDATNTGVQSGVRLRSMHGEVVLSKPNQVFQDREVTGGITVTAQGVTIRNVRLVATDPYYGVRVTPGGDWDRSDAHLTLDHVDIDLNGTVSMKGIAFNGYTADHVFFHNGADCAHFGVNVVIENSYCVLGPDVNGDGAPDSRDFCHGGDHFDGFQSDGGRNIVLQHNTVRNPCGQTSAILMSTNTSPIDRVVIDGNLLSGGGYTVYCGTDSGGVATHESYVNNVISREFFRRGGYWGPTTSCEHVDVKHGNVWDGGHRRPGSSPPRHASGRLLLRKARRLARRALKKELPHRFARHARAVRVRCKRRSGVRAACEVKWHQARHGHVTWRYSGWVILRRRGVHKYHYVLRVKAASHQCGCRRTFKRRGSLHR